MMHDHGDSMIFVEAIQTPGNPNAIGFTFEKSDGSKPSPQEIIDALSEYFMLIDPDTFLPRGYKNPEGH